VSHSARKAARQCSGSRVGCRAPRRTSRSKTPRWRQRPISSVNCAGRTGTLLKSGSPTTLLFDDERNAVVFPSSWLQHRVPEEDADLHQLLKHHVESLETKFGDDFPEQVRSILRTALLADSGSADQVASLFSMHSRTLHRRLAASGTNFRKLVDESRFAIACQMLADTHADISRVASVLNYADSNAFTRAFRRWSGTTPTAWRHQHQQQPQSRIHAPARR
jgi:AraC-like DNA-binding protein